MFSCLKCRLVWNVKWRAHKCPRRTAADLIQRIDALLAYAHAVSE